MSIATSCSPLIRATIEESIIDVSTVHSHNGAGRELQGAGHADFVGFALGDHRVAWQAAVMVEQKVKFYRSLGPPELRPVIHRQTEVNELLERKWITPFSEELHRLPVQQIETLISKLEILTEKYRLTYAENARTIQQVESELAGT